LREGWEEPEALAAKYGDMVYRLAYARTGSRADAEDITQEVFVKLLKKKPVFQDEEHSKAWLLRVAANCANDWFRMPWRSREEPLDNNVPVMAPAGGGENSVLEAVLSLPAKYRIPVHLFYYEDKSAAEIGRILGRSEGAVKTRLCRARKLLRQRLAGEEGGQIVPE